MQNGLGKISGKLWSLAVLVSIFWLTTTGHAASRVVRVQNMTVVPGQTNRLLISLESSGDVSALGFNIAYDTNLLKFVQAIPGTAANNIGATLNVNPNQTTNRGFLGLALGSFTNATFPAGTNVLVEIDFGAPAGVTSASTAVTFTNQPVAPEVSDNNAQVIPVSFVGGTVLIQCGYSLNTNAASFTAAAIASSVNLIADAGCSWSIVNTNPWITGLSPTNGTGSATVNFSVIQNSNLAARVGTIVIAGRTFTVTQAGLVCSYALSSAGQTHLALPETNSFSVIVSNLCPWTVSNANSWIILLNGSNGLGNGSVTYAVEANTSLSPRIGSLLIAGQVFTITQQAVVCSYALSPPGHSHTAAPGTNSFDVIVNTPCPWSVSNANSWVTILAGNGGVGNGTVTYSVAPNPSQSQRSGIIQIAGQSFAVSQLGLDCTFALATTNAAHTAVVETNSFNITTSNSCPWSVSNTNAWISILSGSNGLGNGTVTYSVEANASPAQRTGTLLVADQTFTVTQDGIVCSYLLSATSQVHSAAAQTNSVGLTTVGLCPWFVENTNAWITILSGTNGIGSATVTYSIAQNASLSGRAATLLVGGELFSVTQQAVVCTYTLSESNRAHTASPTTNSINVIANAPCTWAVDNTNAWITILAGSNGIGNGAITYALTTNSISLARVGTLTVNGQVLTVTQFGISCTYAIAPTRRTHGAGAVSGFFGVTTGPGCLWSMVNTNPWIHLVGNGTGTGTVAQVDYTVDANPLSVQRIGYITLPGTSLIITQRTSCLFTFSPSSPTNTSSASSNSVSVTVGSTCGWTATTTDNWITVFSGSETGNGSFGYSVLANLSSTSRTGAVMVAGLTLPIVQAGSAISSFAFQSITMGLTGEISLCLTGGPAGVWELQMSPDLIGWAKLADLTNTTGRVDFVTPNVTNTNRFYRALLP